MHQLLLDNNLNPDDINTQLLLESFRATMRDGLAGRGPLPMVPAGFTLSGRLPVNTDIPAFDVGGTNTRAARVHFDQNGIPTITDIIRGAMPGTHGPVDNETFYDALCDVLQQVLHPDEKLGFCFSYTFDINGVLLFWSKGIRADGIVGTHVPSGLEQALLKRGMRVTETRMLNDTVATLLAAYPYGNTKTYAGHVGFILGTGTNTAYAERTECITKMPHLPAGNMMPINCETGNFTDFPRSAFDDRYEALSGNGHSHFERCISGVHLGPLGTEILHSAARAGLFTNATAKRITERTYSNIELDTFCAGTDTSVFDCSAAEAETVISLIRPMYLRAARFTAVNIAAAALASAEANGASEGTILVNADGSTFKKTACVPFRDIVCNELTALLAPKKLSCDIVQIPDAPLIGAAMAVC